MTTAIIVGLLFVALLMLPGFLRRRRAKGELRHKKLSDALAVVEEAGLTAHSAKADAEQHQKLDNAVRALKEAGYTITPK